jgi:peptide/nickel transport system permease protein
VIGFVLRRVALAAPLLLGVLTLTFLLVESAPGDAADLLLGDRPVPPEVRERLMAAYGLDRPAPERYLRWLSALLLEGEWGWSVSRARPVRAAVADVLPATLLLSGAAWLVQAVLGSALGLLAAAHRGGRVDKLVSAAALGLQALPPFWLGLMAIVAFAYAVPLFPPSSLRSVGADGWPLLSRVGDRLWHLALPCAVLGLASAGGMARYLRAGLVSAAGGPSLLAARARGVAPRRLWLAHALRRAAVPAVQVAALSLPALVSGSLAVEVVFAWPGMGRLAYDALLARDMPLVLAVTCLTAVLVLASSLAADVATALLDPRVRLTASSPELR